MTGRKLGNYDILDKLGEGGMGQVWRAKDARLNRSVAVKVLPPDVAGDTVRRERFEQEARALGALNHPNIVAVYDIGQSDGQAYIVSELVEGESLRAAIERGPITGRKLLDIATQTADGIAAAHALGIVHRDLKPENIMLSRDGRVKVLDFGLAKQNAPITTEETATIALSSPGMVLGTVGYMSPEQVRGEPVDARSDIFSFGCVLYEMASGKQPFAGKSAADVMSAVLREDPPDLATSVPATLGAILHRCLEKDPARRFQSAADLAFALRSIGHLTASQPEIAPAAPARHPRHRWLFVALAAAAGFLLVAAGLFVGKRSATSALPDYRRLTFREGSVTNARFAPDGQNVVYAANWDMQESLIFIGTPGSPEARPLDIKGTRLLSLSSKGDLALLMGPFTPGGHGTLARASLGGGQPRPLLENVRYADWSPDGSEMAVVRGGSGGNLRLEYPIGKVLVESPWILADVRVSPDGQRVAFATFGDGGSSVVLATVDRSGKVERLGVVSGQVAELSSDRFSWTADGREILFRSFDAGTRNTIFAIDMKGKQRAVTRLPGRINLYDVAPDGRMLLSIGSGRLGVRGVAPGETVERDLSCLESSELKALTPDGRIVLVNILGESGGAKGSIYWRMTDGSPPVRLGDGASFAISPDGKWVTGYSSRDTKQRRYVLMPTGAGEEVTLEFPNLPAKTGIVLGWLAGEGNYLVGGLSEARKKWQLHAWHRPSNSLKPASEDGMEDALPEIAPDGKQVLMPHSSKGWMVCDAPAATCKQVPGLSVHDQPIGWRSDNRSIYVSMHHDENRSLMVSVVDTETGKRAEWKMIHPSIPVDSVQGLKVTPDGRAYAYNYSYGRSDLYLASAQ
jgi:Tol biopolymer transport system component